MELILYVKKESPEVGLIDQKHNLVKPRPNNQESVDELIIRDNAAKSNLFVIGGKAYNSFEAGNFIWGTVMQTFYIPIGNTKAGAEGHSYIKTNYLIKYMK